MAEPGFELDQCVFKVSLLSRPTVASFQTRDRAPRQVWVYYAKVKSLGVLSVEPTISFLFYDELFIVLTTSCSIYLASPRQVQATKAHIWTALGWTPRWPLPSLHHFVSHFYPVVSTSATATSSTGVAVKEMGLGQRHLRKQSSAVPGRVFVESESYNMWPFVCSFMWHLRLISVVMYISTSFLWIGE